MKKTLQVKEMIKKLKSYIKMDKKIINFDYTEIEEFKFHEYKSPFLINNINIHEISF